jgi:hypothetical protein
MRAVVCNQDHPIVMRMNFHSLVEHECDLHGHFVGSEPSHAVTRKTLISQCRNWDQRLDRLNPRSRDRINNNFARLNTSIPYCGARG